jgi:hypothetical protein
MQSGEKDVWHSMLYILAHHFCLRSVHCGGTRVLKENPIQSQGLFLANDSSFPHSKRSRGSAAWSRHGKS